MPSGNGSRGCTTSSRQAFENLMRILYVVHQFYPEFGSGTERVTLNLARMAQRAGHHVQVLGCMLDRGQHRGVAAPGLAEALTYMVDGIGVTMLARASLPPGAETELAVSETVRDQLAAWMEAQRFDVMHLMHPMRSASAIAAAQRIGLPLVLTLTDYFAACLRINLMDVDGRPCAGPDGGRACARKCSLPAWNEAALRARHEQFGAVLSYAASRVVPSLHVAQRYRAAFPALSFDVIAHGIDLLALGAAPAPPAGSRPLTLGFVGSLVVAKGLHVLLRALARVRGLPLRLKVAGGFHGDAAYQAELRALAAADDRVELLGMLDPAAVAALMRQLDVLCLPSQVPESFSLVVHEAAALGVPSLVGHLGAPAEAIARSGAGRVVPAGDEAAWAAAIRGCVDDPGQLAVWRRALPLPQRIEEEAFLYEGLYRQAIGSVPAAASTAG
jgi:glycosyltransferase involved in cell wall biosynthesis